MSKSSSTIPSLNQHKQASKPLNISSKSQKPQQISSKTHKSSKLSGKGVDPHAPNPKGFGSNKFGVAANTAAKKNGSRFNPMLEDPMAPSGLHNMQMDQMPMQMEGMPMQGMPMQGMPMQGMPMQGMPGMMDPNMQLRGPSLHLNNTHEVNGVKYLDSKNHIYDTESNINYYNMNENFQTYARPLYPHMKGDVGGPYMKKVIKTIIKDSRNHWLEFYWGDLSLYLVVDGKNVRLVKSEGEFKKQKENKYKDIKVKEDFLRENLLTKSYLKKLAKKYISHNGFSNDESEFNHYLRKYIHKKIKGKIINAIKENL